MTGLPVEFPEGYDSRCGDPWCGWCYENRPPAAPQVLPEGFVWDEPRKCVLCRETCGVFYVPLKSYLHPECLSAFTDDAA